MDVLLFIQKPRTAGGDGQLNRTQLSVHAGEDLSLHSPGGRLPCCSNVTRIAEQLRSWTAVSGPRRLEAASFKESHQLRFVISVIVLEP